jgi:hypothetical protein
MNIVGSLAIIALAALIHASFQLSVSVLTLLSGHAIGAKRSQSKVLGLTSSFVFGATVMTILLLAFTAFVMSQLFGSTAPEYLWAIVSGVAVGVGIAVWALYYRREKGTSLWIPRNVAKFLSDRTKATKQNAEAFGLGLSSVIGEVLFIAAPIAISALVLIHLPPMWQLVGVALYVVISLFSLVTVWVLIGSGHTLGRIQRWRETNKYFLQFAAGSGLLVLGFFVYVNEVLGPTLGGS